MVASFLSSILIWFSLHNFASAIVARDILTLTAQFNYEEYASREVFVVRGKSNVDITCQLPKNSPLESHIRSDRLTYTIYADDTILASGNVSSFENGRAPAAKVSFDRNVPFSVAYQCQIRSQSVNNHFEKWSEKLQVFSSVCAPDQSNELTSTLDQPVTMDCPATETQPMQWYLDGRPLHFTGRQLKIEKAGKLDEGVYECSNRGQCFQNYNLTVLFPPEPPTNFTHHDVYHVLYHSDKLLSWTSGNMYSKNDVGVERSWTESYELRYAPVLPTSSWTRKTIPPCHFCAHNYFELLHPLAPHTLYIAEVRSRNILTDQASDWTMAVFWTNGSDDQGDNSIKAILGEHILAYCMVNLSGIFRSVEWSFCQAYDRKNDVCLSQWKPLAKYRVDETSGAVIIDSFAPRDDGTYKCFAVVNYTVGTEKNNGMPMDYNVRVSQANTTQKMTPPMHVDCSNVTSSSMKVKWSGASSVRTEIATYRIRYRKNEPDSVYDRAKMQTEAGYDKECVYLHGLSADTSYEILVSAVDKDELESAPATHTCKTAP